jgi:hypothetical protein
VTTYPTLSGAATVTLAWSNSNTTATLTPTTRFTADGLVAAFKLIGSYLAASDPAAITSMTAGNTAPATVSASSIVVNSVQNSPDELVAVVSALIAALTQRGDAVT